MSKGCVRLEGLKEFLDIHNKTTIYGLIRRGKLPAPIKAGRCSLWRIVDLERWLDEQKPAGELSAT